MSTIKELMKSQDFNAVKEVLRKEYKDIKDIKSFEDTFETICRINPTYDYFDSIILIKKSGNAVRVTNTHLGSLSDLAGRNYKKESGITDVEAAAHSLYQIVEGVTGKVLYLLYLIICSLMVISKDMKH